MWVLSTCLVLLATVVLGPMQLAELGGKVEPIKNVWTSIHGLLKWLNYPNELAENVNTLKRKKKELCCRRDDVKEELETAELELRTKPKGEVDCWLKNVQNLESEVARITRGFEERNFLKRAWQGSQVEKKIKEVDKLSKEGRFEDGLVLKSRTCVDALLTKTLLDTQKMDMDKIWECVICDETRDDALIIGVTGKQGIGKTVIIEHIYNRFIASKYCVCFVTISEEYSIRKLQNDIAKEIGFSFGDEEDERKRVAMLNRRLSAKEKSVLILDGLPIISDGRQIHISLDKIGISPQMNGFKLILTSRLPAVCRRMNCRQTIEVTPLPLVEAKKLFMKEVELNDECDSEIKLIAEQIVNECACLPSSIVNTAGKLMGVDDIREWRTTLTELKLSGVTRNTGGNTS